MKILITSDLYAPEINGVVTSIINLKRGLEQDGHDVRILTLAHSKNEYKAGKVYQIGSFKTDLIYPDTRVAIPKKCKLIKELIDWKPDVIHSQCEFSTFLFATYISKKTGAPIIHTYHTVYEDYTHYFCPSKSFGKKAVSFFTSQVSKKTKAFIAPTEKMQEMLEGYHIKAPVKIIPSGINLKRFTEESHETRKRIRKQYGINKDDCLLIFLGRLAKEKNIDELINFLDSNQAPNIKLMITGDGPCKHKLIEECKSLKKSERIIFTGMIEPEHVADYYSAADIFVSASTSETQGLTYIEAMASGLPVLCRYDTCLDGVITNEKNGYLYRNKTDFDAYLKLLSENSAMRHEKGMAARNSVLQKYSIETFVKACEELYLEYVKAA